MNIINNTTMSQQRLGDAFDPVVDFGERKLRVLITDKKFDEAIEAIIVRSSMMADRLTLEIKRTAVNHTTDIWDNVTTLMIAARDGAPLALVQQLCEIGGKPLISVAADRGGLTALPCTSMLFCAGVLIPTWIL